MQMYTKWSLLRSIETRLNVEKVDSLANIASLYCLLNVPCSYLRRVLYDLIVIHHLIPTSIESVSNVAKVEPQTIHYISIISASILADSPENGNDV